MVNVGEALKVVCRLEVTMLDGGVQERRSGVESSGRQRYRFQPKAHVVLG